MRDRARHWSEQGRRPRREWGLSFLPIQVVSKFDDTTQAQAKAQAQEKGARSFLLCLRLRRPGSHVAYARACAYVVRVNQPLGLDSPYD